MTQQLELPLPLLPPRCEIGGAWYSTASSRIYVGPCCVDCSWPVFKVVPHD